jgi:3-methyladenine DNA glycosylase AlkC
MPTALKYIYNEVFFGEFCTAAKKTIPGFNQKTFIEAVHHSDWEALELKQRMRRLSTVLQSFLPGNYAKQLATILDLIDCLPKPGNVQYGGLAYMFLPDFVEQFGQHDLKRSLQAMEKVTPFTSCEFVIRPFLKNHLKETMFQMQEWSKHPNEHVRRFASEGCRPRLPWGMVIESLKKDPAAVLPILERLKNDPSAYVRRSVANNMNDISKDHPLLVIELAAKWLGKTADTDRLLKHACRGLLKSGNSKALGLFGTATDVPCNVRELQFSSKQITMGSSLQFSFDVQMLAKEAARLRIEYGVHFMKANGQQQQKVFKIAECAFNPAQKISFQKKHAFKDLTTRKHYEGAHEISIIVNGLARQQLSFMLQKNS